MKIQDVESKTGLDRATIRFYEKEGLVIPVRQENGYRIYSIADVQLIQKIKLLRHLGVSLSKIKSLQHGDSDLPQILDQQIVLLGNKIKDDSCARLVCMEMRNAGVKYGSLDAELYLKMLQESNYDNKSNYQEPVQKEAHPFRRYFARNLDLLLITTVVGFIIVSIVRIRPYTDTLQTVLRYLSYFMFIPIEALMLHSWGTTPGKWLMGIRVENANGGNLSYNDALKRSFNVVMFGYLFFIPVISLWPLYKNFRSSREGERSDWDEDSEILYVNWKPLHKTLIATVTVLTLLLNFFIGFDAYNPPIKTTDLTLPKFIHNYRASERILGYTSVYELAADGTWKDQSTNEGHIILINTDDHPRENFNYSYDDEGNIQSIYYADRWNDYFGYVLPKHCAAAIYALVNSRSNAGIDTQIEIADWINHGYKDMIHSLDADNPTTSGSVQYLDVNIQWTIHHSEHAYIINGSLVPVNADNNIPLWYQLELTISIE